MQNTTTKTFITENVVGTHIGRLKEIAAKSDKLIVVSPFLADDMSKIVKQMSTIKYVDIYTNLDGFGVAPSIIKSLHAFSDYCDKSGIKLNMYYDNELHGKVYLFYKGDTPTGFIIGSSNFTDKGLEKNKEYGLAVTDSSIQEAMYEMIKEQLHCGISTVHLDDLYKKAIEFEKNNPVPKPKVFKATCIIKTKESVQTRYLVKSIGRRDKWHPEEPLVKDIKLGFSNTNVYKGDILIINAIGHTKLVGIYMVADDTWEEYLDGPDDKWPYKYTLKCLTKEFSQKWWLYDIKTMALADDFAENKVSATDFVLANQEKDSLKAMQRGRPFEVSRAFVDFVNARIKEKLK